MNYKIILISTALLILSCETKQKISYPEFYNRYRELTGSLNKKSIDTIISEFDELEDLVKNVPSSYYFGFARFCAEEGKCDAAANYLKLALINGQEYGKGIGAYKTIVPCPEEIELVLNEESKIHNQNFNFTYKRLIDSIYTIDQNARNKQEFERVKVIDSLNMLTILREIELNGFPSAKNIGHASAWNAFIVLLHMDRDKNNEVLKPILDKALSEGEIWPRGYAWIVDRRRAWGDEKLEPYYYHMPSKKYDSFSLERINEINRRRDSIGLEPK